MVSQERPFPPKIKRYEDHHKNYEVQGEHHAFSKDQQYNERPLGHF